MVLMHWEFQARWKRGSIFASGVCIQLRGDYPGGVVLVHLLPLTFLMKEIVPVRDIFRPDEVSNFNAVQNTL